MLDGQTLQQAYALAESLVATGRYGDASRLIVALLTGDSEPNHHHLRLLLEEIVEAAEIPTAEIGLAMILLAGETGDSDPDRACALLQGALDRIDEAGAGGGADLQAGVAHELLADCYVSGIGVDADQGAAFRHYQQAAELGRAKAALNVGLAYDAGLLDQTVDRQAARAYYEQAAEAGQAEAMTNLALGYLADGDAPDEASVLELLERASALGDPRADEVLMELAERGLPEDDETDDQPVAER